MTDVINLARARGKDGSLLMVTLGDTASLEKALFCVKEGTKTGCWVVLENCHLAANWSKEFVQQLHVRHKSELENILLFCYCCV